MTATAHSNCRHDATKKARANCRKIAAQVASYVSMTDLDLSAAMREGVKVTGWDVYDEPNYADGVVKREKTGYLDYVETGVNGTKIWTIRFQLDPTGKTCSPALESAATFPAERIRLAD